MPLPTNVYFNLASDLCSGYLTLVSRVPCARVVSCVAILEGEIASWLILFHPMTVEKSLRVIQHHTACLLQNLSLQIRSAEWSFILVKINHLKIDVVVCLASDGNVLGRSPLLCIIWTYWRLMVVWMVSVDQDHVFPDQHLLQLGIRSGYLTVVSRVPCAKNVRCIARYEGIESSIISYSSFNDSREVFSGFYTGI